MGTLQRYLEAPCIERLILIDNAPQFRPSGLETLKKTAKLAVLTQEENLLVNASWNLGMLQISDPLCVTAILNDDITLPVTTLMGLETHSWKEGDVIGLLPSSLCNASFCLKEIPYKRGISIGSQYQGFGSALFLQRRNYRQIPASLKIWFGDDWLLQEARRVLGFLDVGIEREHHVSMRAMRQSDSFCQQLTRDKEAAAKLLQLQL